MPLTAARKTQIFTLSLRAVKGQTFLLQSVAQAAQVKGADISRFPALLSSIRLFKHLLPQGSSTLSERQEILHTPGLL